MPQFYVRFDGEVWLGHGRPIYKEIVDCIITARSRMIAHERAEDLIPCVAKRYPFPFKSEEDGGVPIKEEDISFALMPLTDYINNLKQEETCLGRLISSETSNKE